MSSSVAAAPFIKALKEFASGVAFSTFLLVRAKTTKQTKAQKDFLSVEFADSTGTFTASLWGDGRPFAALNPAPEGVIVAVEGTADYFNGNFSPKITVVTVLTEAEASVHVSRLVESSLYDPKKMTDEFIALLGTITNQGVRTLVSAVFGEVGRSQFLSGPAARSMHHAWRSGLLEHTLGMLKLADAIAPLYPHVKFNRDLLIAGIALHDLGKVQEYEQGLAHQSTIRGRLIGHIPLIYGLLVKHASILNLPQDLTDGLGHIILSHHGRLEYGSPVVPSTPEAILVSQIDLVDSRMGALQASLRSDGAKPITAYNRALECQVVLQIAPPAPVPAALAVAPAPVPVPAQSVLA